VRIETRRAGPFDTAYTGRLFGYVVEGDTSTPLNDERAYDLQGGDTYYEPSGASRVTRTRARGRRTRLLAVILHPATPKRSRSEEAAQETICTVTPTADGSKAEYYLPGSRV